MATLHTSDGHVLPVLGGLLQARCPKLHGDGAKAFYAGEELTVVLPLLQWVYSGRVQDQPVSAGCGDCALFARMLQLAEGWGLRDAGELQDLLLAKRSRRRRSSLAEDLLAAYRSGHLRSVVFYCPTFKDEDEEVGLWPLDGGLATLLQLRSEYFRAMFRGGWAESFAKFGSAVTVYWPRDQLVRLVEFVHGGTFVAKPEDLRVAVDCAAFFGVPSLLHHVREWIAANLKVATAPLLWTFVESEPQLKHQEVDGCDDAEDVEAACFEFHLEHFAELAGVKVWESFGQEEEMNDASLEVPPLHSLSIDLFHRLLMSGLVRLPTRQLMCVVERFARAKCSDLGGAEAFAKLFTSLMPPAVIFNRDCRSALLQSNDQAPARAIMVN